MPETPLIALSHADDPAWKRCGAKILEFGLGLNWFNRHYPKLERQGHFFNDCLNYFGVDYHVKTRDPLPTEGACLVVANHPFGAIEGIFLGDWLQQQRPDVKILANGLLAKIPEVKDMIIEVNPFGGQERANAKGMLQAIKWLREGHILLTFPAGEVSSFNKQLRKITDPIWSPHCAKLARKGNAPLLPLFVEGRNSILFQGLGLIHPRLRTLRLGWELINKRHRSFSVRGGHLIPTSTFDKLKHDKDLRDFLRDQSEALNPKNKTSFGLVDQSHFEPIAPETPAQKLMDEIENLAPDRLLLERQHVQLFTCPAKDIPHTLREIGRLREITFRATDEGCGKALDLDQHDEHYLHLFSWDNKAKRIVGAYRIGRTDDILDQHGPEGLYSYSLFRLSELKCTQLRTGLELGRSFIVEDYQKSRHGLPLLWRGILSYIAQNPQYRTLYGCVSICSAYQKESIDLMTDYCRLHHSKNQHGVGTSPIHPYQRSSEEKAWLAALSKSDINPDDLSDWVSQLEPDQKGIPVLLRHYLRIGGHIISFNVDKSFGNVVDGLVLVDLDEANHTMVEKFMGKEAAKAYFTETDT